MMHRSLRRAVFSAGLVLAMAPACVQAQFTSTVGQGYGSAFAGNIGGFGQIFTVANSFTVTRLGFFLTSLSAGPQTFSAFIASASNPTVRLWESTFTRNLPNTNNTPPALIQTDALSVLLTGGSTYIFGYYTNGGNIVFGWSTAFAETQNGITLPPGGTRSVSGTGVVGTDCLASCSGNGSLAISINGTPVVTPPTTPPTNVIPEPSTYALMGTGLVGLLAMRRRRSPVA